MCHPSVVLIYPPLFYTAKRQNISELSFILFASTFKSTDSLSSAGDTVKVNENQQQARLEDKATERLSHCLKKWIFKTISPPSPPGLLLPGCFKKSCIRETPTLSTDADRRTDTNFKRLRDLSLKKK